MIKCSTCSAENKDDAKFCIVCGSPSKKSSNEICPNGHVFDSKLGKCPYCPSGDLKTRIRSFDAGSSTETFSDSDKTNIISGEDGSARSSRTIILTPEGKSDTQGPKGTRKLIGWLVTFTFKKEGEDYKLYEGRNLITGDSSGQIVLSDPTVSSPHCMILYRGGKIKIKDELSTNGTFVNGSEIEESELKDGDVIRIGKTELKYRSVE